MSKYVIVRAYEVPEYSSKGYEPVGGGFSDPDRSDYLQAMALYEDVLVDVSPPSEVPRGSQGDSNTSGEA